MHIGRRGGRRLVDLLRWSFKRCRFAGHELSRQFNAGRGGWRGTAEQG